MKKATHYPQIWHVNLETLSLLSENWVDTKQKQSFAYNFIFQTNKI